MLANVLIQASRGQDPAAATKLGRRRERGGNRAGRRAADVAEPKVSGQLTYSEWVDHA